MSSVPGGNAEGLWPPSPRILGGCSGAYPVRIAVTKDQGRPTDRPAHPHEEPACLHERRPGPDHPRLYATGLCALLIAIGTLISLKWYLAHATKASSTPAAGVFDYLTQSASRGLAGRASLSFGFPLLIYGVVLVILAAVLRPRRMAVDAEWPPSD